MRYFFHIGYNGINYRGWQHQKGVLCIQDVVQDCVRKLLKRQVNCLGCGRTDAKVHASQYFFHIDNEEPLDLEFKFRLNKMLPDDIALFDIIPMDGYPHAQLDAKKRTYDYFIHTYKDPFLSGFSALYMEQDLDLASMKKASKLLMKYKDYSAFCKSPDKNDSNYCDVSSTKLFVGMDGGRIRFQITSNRFLKGMVRIIARKLIDVGTGVLSVEQFENYLTKKEIPKNTVPAYPQGLYLTKITYPFLDIPPRTEHSVVFQSDVENAWREL
ncbi:MAG: tRNA pseudouridine(38-40) synthase TruA [Tenuifilaceae bacterium]